MIFSIKQIAILKKDCSEGTILFSLLFPFYDVQAYVAKICLSSANDRPLGPESSSEALVACD